MLTATLFDLGFTHSFISPLFASRLVATPSRLGQDMIIMGAFESQEAYFTYLESCIEVTGQIMLGDLVILDI